MSDFCVASCGRGKRGISLVGGQRWIITLADNIFSVPSLLLDTSQHYLTPCPFFHPDLRKAVLQLPGMHRVPLPTTPLPTYRPVFSTVRPHPSYSRDSSSTNPSIQSFTHYPNQTNKEKSKNSSPRPFSYPIPCHPFLPIPSFFHTRSLDWKRPTPFSSQLRNHLR